MKQPRVNVGKILLWNVASFSAGVVLAGISLKLAIVMVPLLFIGLAVLIDLNRGEWA